MRLPVGQSDFEQIIKSEFDYVDKSLFIKEIIEDDQIILITRPRRFGKTLNLSMLQYFFGLALDGHSSKQLFGQLNIAKESAICAKHQQQYPVISFSLKDVKGDSFSKISASIGELIAELYDQHDYLLASSALKKREKVIYESILNQQAKEIDIENALKKLVKYLYLHYDNSVIVLIDEYDTPIQSGYLHGYYDKIVEFFRIFFGSALKDNKYIAKAVLTGILRISKENLFSGLNNLVACSILDKQYSSYFGFTEAEVTNLIHRAKLDDQLSNIKAWYNGYMVGGQTIYNPWSIASYLRQRELQLYWINTSDNALIKGLIIKSSLSFKQELELLLQDQPLSKLIDPNIVFADLNESEAAIWSLLLMSGYLKSTSSEYTVQGVRCQLQIPNQEVRALYRQIIEQWLSDDKGVDWYNQFLAALLRGDIETFEAGLGAVMLQTVSYYDLAQQPEAFYQGLMIGLTTSLDRDQYRVTSNKESGYGRYDIMITPTDVQQLGILLELKSIKCATDVTENERMVLLTQAAQQAVSQIKHQHYESECKQHGISRWLAIGLAFSGKHFSLHAEQHD